MLLGLPSNFAEDRFARLGGLNCWIVTVSYFLNSNSISDRCTDFRILGFIRGFPYPKQCLYLCDVVDISQYLLYAAILVKEIHVWFSVIIKYTV